MYVSIMVNDHQVRVTARRPSHHSTLTPTQLAMLRATILCDALRHRGYDPTDPVEVRD